MATRINLLPWREARRKDRQRQTIVVGIGGLILAAAVVLLVHIQMNNWIDRQNARNDYLAKAIAELDRQIAEIKTLEDEKAKLLARIAIIQDLQANRTQTVHLLDELVTTLPDGVQYTSLRQQGPSLTIEGLAQSNARVSTLMRNVEAANWLQNPVLDVTETTEKGNTRETRYVLRVNQKNPADAKTVNGAVLTP
jgi:type IV pilus assembly protein PilN